MLVDSGSDTCIFDAQIAGILQIDLKKGREEKVVGITGGIESYYLHSVIIRVGGWPFRIEAGFLPRIASLGYGVVGQKGFFDIFIVKFDLLKEEVELMERRHL